jgi:pyrimidine operon attenuation protein / uracil phosphoribosyltransferase
LNAALVTRSRLYTTAELELVIDTMADQLAASLRPGRPLVVIGILRRGAPLADRLTDRLVQRHGLPRPLRLDLAVKRYADDLTLLHPQTRLDESAQIAALDLADQTLLVVDDVLYSGHSMLKVVAYLAQKGPAEIRVATLVDRCVAQLPVHADVVGTRLQVAPGAIVECHVPPYEPEFAIELVQGGRPA